MAAPAPRQVRNTRSCAVFDQAMLCSTVRDARRYAMTVKGILEYGHSTCISYKSTTLGFQKATQQPLKMTMCPFSITELRIQHSRFCEPSVIFFPSVNDSSTYFVSLLQQVASPARLRVNKSSLGLLGTRVGSLGSCGGGSGKNEKHEYGLFFFKGAISHRSAVMRS